MRRIAAYRSGGGLSVIPVPGNPGNAEKVGFAGLLPGGMTLDAVPGTARFLHDISPEPVIGPGVTKGIAMIMTMSRASRNSAA